MASEKKDFELIKISEVKQAQCRAQQRLLDKKNAQADANIVE